MSNILFITSSPRGSANQVAARVIDELWQPDPQALERATKQARSLVEARRSLIAELEQQRRVLGAAA